MNISVATMFRNSVSWHGHSLDHIPKIFDQLQSQTVAQYITEIVCIEGGSTDNTREKLEEISQTHCSIPVTILHEEPLFDSVASIVDSHRLASLSNSGNRVLRNISKEADCVFWVESDLIFNTDVIERLLEGAAHENVGVVSPIIMLQGGRWETAPGFYDTFCFESLSGSKWQQRSPWSHDYNNGQRYIENGSIGSMALIDANLILEHGVSFGQNCFLDLCAMVRKLQRKVYVDKETIIYHPGSHCIQERWI